MLRFSSSGLADDRQFGALLALDPALTLASYQLFRTVQVPPVSINIRSINRMEFSGESSMV
jgi:hypothetical protein